MLTTENRSASDRVFPKTVVLMISAAMSKIAMQIDRAKVKVERDSSVHLTEYSSAAEAVEV
jgi:hypothetical protein